MPVHILDKYYLGITILITTAYQLLGFFIAWTFQFDKITDFTGGSNFFLLAIFTLCVGDTFNARGIVASVLVMVWASRTAGFLLFRVLKTGSDARFDDIRSHFLKFLGFWIAQILWVWVVSLPVTILNSPGVSDTAHGGANPAFGTGRDIAGIIIWALGWSIETIADFQKYNFKATKPPKEQPPNFGLWYFSRHPSYFGEILCWWGIWIITLSPSTNGGLTGGPKRAQLAAITSPLFTTVLLLFGSGMPTAEKPTAERYYLLSASPANHGKYPQAWANYKEYLRSTSILIPLPPVLYRPLPMWIKRWILLDLPIYHFDEKTDGPLAVQKVKDQQHSVNNEQPSNNE
ncbi:hypothetical protein M422DRAFT_23827 [Sphaerobolus stellatus SS14]|nr:hypothetical protein M422DRAFT_23827 [Sphaerobolus stellatus SS14]